MVANDRRRFLCESGLTACVLPLLQFLPSAFAQPETVEQLREQLRPQPDPDEEIDQETLDFWTRRVRTPTLEAAKARPVIQPIPRDRRPTPLGRTRPTALPEPMAPLLSAHVENEPVFFFYDKDLGFQRAHMLKPDLLPRKGDVEVFVQVLECRPSADEYDRIAKSDSGSLRIDVQQGQPMPNLEEPLAWTALAALLPNSKEKSSKANTMDFDLGTAWGKTKRVPMPGGLGYWTWNLFLKDKDSPWSKLIDFIRAGSRTASTYLVGLPSIGKTALTQVDELLGRIQAVRRSRWVFQSRDVELYATRESRDRVGPRAIQLKTGEYILLPASQGDGFEEIMGKLKLVDGKLVPADTVPGRLTRAAETTLPDATYLTVHVAARPKEFCKSPSA